MTPMPLGEVVSAEHSCSLTCVLSLKLENEQLGSDLWPEEGWKGRARANDRVCVQDVRSDRQNAKKRFPTEASLLLVCSFLSIIMGYTSE